MCGIAGFYKKNRESKDPFCSRGVARLQGARGPDGVGLSSLLNGAVKLFHQRLSIIDLSDAGKQPMASNCPSCGRGIRLIYNGEIYNYRELKHELLGLGHVFHSQTDTEVIVHAYAEYGLEAFNKLNGVFSLALFDGRENTNSELINKNDLILIRGPIGVKPLYFTNNNNNFSFASELKTLLLDSNVSRNLDYQALDEYLTYLWCPAPKTPLKAVKKLEPGCFLIIRGGEIFNHKRYYDIPVKQNSEIYHGSIDDLIAETKHNIEMAVQRQMVSDVPIGAFLSGGLDSSAIVACMKNIEPGIDIDCYTIKSKDDTSEGFVSDYPYALKVAKHLNVNLNTVHISSDIYKHIPKMVYHLDEPQADIAPINAYLIAEQAHNNGYKVLMSGAGGDDIFTGYRRHYALSKEKYWQWLPKPMRSRMSSVARNVQSVKHPVIRRLSKLFAHCDKDNDDRLVSFFEWSNVTTRSGLFNEDIVSGSPLIKTLENLNNRKNISSLNQMLYLECKHFLADHNLNYTDKMTMAHSVETRVPLLDLELVSYAFSLPETLKQKGKIGKYIFKKSMESYLPNDVIYRPKTGFGAPVRSWIHGGMRAAVDEVLCKSSLDKRGIFDYQAVANLRKMDFAGKIDASYIILGLFNIELWCRTFIDQSIPAPVDLW